MAPHDPANAAAAFQLSGRICDVVTHHQGHINDTFIVTADAGGPPLHYVLQRINHAIFKDVAALMENIQRVTAHLAKRLAESQSADARRRVLTVIPANDGRPFHRDEQDNWWRCYECIERVRSYDIIEHPRQAAAAAKAFGEFQTLLADLPGGRLHETIPFFHDTRRRFDHLRRVVDSDPCNRAGDVREEIAFALEREEMVDVLLELARRGAIPERITHNDTKLNNILFDEVTQEALCVIDLDTVMPGLSLHDFGDMVRSGTNSAAEDEPDVSIVESRLSIFEGLVEGYLSATRPFLNEAEIAHLAFSGRLITFEMGLRFLADFIEGDVYYKTHRPGHNRDRARNQFALIRSMEAQQDAMEAIVRKHATRRR
jgi:hypothetical protein